MFPYLKNERAPIILFSIGFALLPLIWPGLWGTSSDLLPKRLGLYFFVGLSVLLWFLQGGQFKRSPLHVPAILFVLFGLLSLTWAINPFTGSIEALQLSVGLILFHTFGQCFNPKHALHLFQSISVGGMCVSLIGIAQYLGLGFAFLPSVGMPSSTFIFRNMAAAYLVTAIPLSALAFFLDRHAIRRHFWATATMLMGLYLIYTRTRGAWVGLIMACAIALLTLALNPNLRTTIKKYGKQENQSPMYLWIIALYFIPFGIGLFLPAHISNTTIQQFDEQKTSALGAAASLTAPGSDRGRLALWKNTLHLITDHPLIGVGLDNWEYAFPPYDKGEIFTIFTEFVRPHNDFLWIASELGLIGLGIYLWVLIKAGTMAWRCIQKEDGEKQLIAFAASIGILALLGQSLFGFSREEPTASAFFWLHLALIGSIVAPPSTIKTNRKFAAPILGLVLTLVGIYITSRQIAFDQHFFRAQSAMVQSQPTLALKEIRQAIADGPFDHRAQFLEGQLLQQLGRPEESESAYLKALLQHPNYAHTHHNLGRIYAKQKKWPQAMEAYQHALKIRPNYGQANISLGQAWLAKGQLDNALQSFEKAYQDAPGLYEALGNIGAVYLYKKQFDKAIAPLEKAVGQNPNYIEAQNNLAYAYEQTGRYQEAITAYTFVLKNWQGDPEYRQTLRQHIASLQQNLEQP